MQVRELVELLELADLILVDGDPTIDVSDIRRVVTVIKNGRVYGADADTFQRVPETGRPVIEVHHSAVLPSHARLPLVPRP